MKHARRALAATALAGAAVAFQLATAGPGVADDTWKGSGYDLNCPSPGDNWDHMNSGMCLRPGQHISTDIVYGSTGIGGLVTTEEAYRVDYGEDGNLVISHWKTWIPPEVGGPPNFTKLAKMILECAVGGSCQDGDTQVDVVWQSGTAGRSAGAAVMQQDGNFVVYDADGNAAWNSGTEACNGQNVWARMQQDGNFVLYKGHADGEGADQWKAVWSTKNGRTGEPC
ncbi:hypothetical protein ACQB60_29580 [Actinomycetota bacterium Odt1-20B]